MKRVATDYIITRKQKRFIAKRRMKEEGKTNYCKHSYTGIKKGNFTYYTRVPSYFSEHWREYTEAAV